MRCRCGGPEYEITDDGVFLNGVRQRGRLLTDKLLRWTRLINEQAARWNVPAALIAGVMMQESGGEPRAKSPIATPAYGLMQVLHSTANTEYALVYGQPRNLTEDELFDPELNVTLGSHLLSRLMKLEGGNVVHVLADYNRGRVQCGKARANAQPSRWNVVENQGYVDGVLASIAGALDAGFAWTAVPTVSGWSGTLARLAGGALIGALVAVAVTHVATPANR